MPALRAVTPEDRGLVRRVHALCEGAGVVVEEIGVDAQRHRRGGVAEQPLDRLDAIDP